MKNIICVLFACALFLVGCEDDSVKNAEMPPSDHQQEAVNEVRDCPDIMKYKVGDYVFGIDRKKGKFQAYTRIEDGRYSQLPYCQEGIQEAQKIRYRPYQFGDHGELKNKHGILSFSIFKANELTDAYTHMKVDEKLEQAAVELGDLPIEDGFYKFEFAGNQFLFIANQSGVKTKLGNPLTFYCTPNVYNRTVLKCGTNFLWKDNLSIGAGYIYTSGFPVSQWPTLYLQLQEFADSLIIKETKLEE